MRIEVNNGEVRIDGKVVSDTEDDEISVTQSSGRRNRIVINDQEVTGFWGGCIAFLAAAFALLITGVTLLGVALMLASPLLILIGLGWLIAQAIP